MRTCSKEWGPHLHIAITTYKNNWTIEMLKIAVQHLCTSPYVVMQRRRERENKQSKLYK